MIKIKYSVRPFVKPNAQVAVRVRWNDKNCEVTFITGVYGDKDKWDEERQKATKHTIHKVGRKTFSAEEINETIIEFQEAIAETMEKYELKQTVPTALEFKKAVNKILGRDREKVITKRVKMQSMQTLFDEFMRVGSIENNWSDDAVIKYRQAFKHLMAAVPKLTPRSISLETLLTLKKWYVDKGYTNRTINKMTTTLKSFLKWIHERGGYALPDAVLKFSTKLKVISKTVTFLNYNELLHFANFNFSTDRLSHARDLWVFMATTSLRYSDLRNLKIAHIINGRIEMTTQKTADRITIPLTDLALDVLAKYKDQPQPDGKVFLVPSNQKLNDALKDAAKEAGLDRLILDTYFVGNERIEKQYHFYEILSCHDARRTFVSCSLAMGIPPQVVMKATGHKGYNTMKPYIDTATDTQTLEMEKWNRSKYRAEIITLLDRANEEQLIQILNGIKTVV